MLAFLCMAPFVIPGIVLAIGFYAAYAPPPLALYGTGADPDPRLHAPASCRSPIVELRRGLRSAQPGDGGGGPHPRRQPVAGDPRVVVPLLKKSLAGAWLLVFIPATRELSHRDLPRRANTRVISVMMFDLSEEGNFEMLAALGFILLVASRS